MVYEFENFTIDENRRELVRDGVAVALQPRTLDLVLYLIRHRDRVVSKDELQDEVWGTIVTEDAVARGVMKARKVLGDSPGNPRFIRTIRGRGYRFVQEPTAVRGGRVERDSPHAPLDRRAAVRQPARAILRTSTSATASPRKS